MRRAAIGIASGPAIGASPAILTSKGRRARRSPGSVLFRPAIVQAGTGPHLGDLAYTSDLDLDPFRSQVEMTGEGILIHDTGTEREFALNVRWNVEGFGFLFLSADNGGNGYRLPASGKTEVLNLNFELARSLVVRNRRRLDRHSRNGWRPSREVSGLTALSEGLLEDAAGEFDLRKADLSQRSLLYSLQAGEAMEMERARHSIGRSEPRKFFFGCDARAYFQMDADLFLERFIDLFDYATVNHYLVGDRFDFEPEEGRKRFQIRKIVSDELRHRGVTVQGRPLVWFHHWTTPEWLREKDYDGLLRYVERHVREVVGFYQDDLYAWEVVNEMHDWANELELTPEQMVEVTRLACAAARDAHPGVRLLINNCCPFAEYVQESRWVDRPARFPQRSPYGFVQDLISEAVDFDLIGVQMYFPERDLCDTIRLLEKFEKFGKTIHVSETGASSGPSDASVRMDRLNISNQPYSWRRPWDERLQADWAEAMYTLAFSRPQIEGIHWYDFVDPHSFIPNGGLLRSVRGEPKAAYHRLQTRIAEWKRR